MFADVDDLELYLQRQFSNGESQSAAQALELATGVIRAHTGQEIAPVTQGAAFTVFNASGRFIFLPHPPTIPVEVTQVEVDGDALSSDEWRLLSMGVVEKVQGAWRGTAKVTYDHGFTEAPDDVRAVTLQAASRAMMNPQGIQSERLGQYSITYSEGFGGTLVGAGPQLTNLEMRMMDRYRLQGVA